MQAQFKGYWVKLEDGETWGAHVSCVTTTRDLRGRTVELTTKAGEKSLVEILECIARYDCFGICKVRKLEEEPEPQKQTRPTAPYFTKSKDGEWVVAMPGEEKELDKSIWVDVRKKDGSTQKVLAVPYWVGEHKGQTTTIATVARLTRGTERHLRATA